MDTEYIYSLAKTSKLSELEEFIAAPNVANIQAIGERLFDEVKTLLLFSFLHPSRWDTVELIMNLYVQGNYEAARLLFKNINNNSKLALCYINLNLYREAVEAAQKANSISTYKEVNIACVKVTPPSLSLTPPSPLAISHPLFFLSSALLY